MEKELNCVNTRYVMEYVKANNNGSCSELLGGLHPEIDCLPDPESFLFDTNNWVSSTVQRKLLERARSILRDDRVAYKIGRYAIEKQRLGYAQRIIVRAIGVIQTLKHIQKVNDRWNLCKRVELVDMKKTEATIRLHWKSGMDLSKDFCLINQGIYTFIPLIWGGGKPATLSESCCFFEGAPYCEYHVKWPVRNLLKEFFSAHFRSKAILMETISEMERDKEIIQEKYREVNRLNAELNRKIKQLVAIQETGKAILSILELKQLLAVIMNILSNVCMINRAIIMLIDGEAKCLRFIHGVGFPGEIPDEIKNYTVSLDRLNNILARVASTGRSEYVPDVASSSLRKKNIVLSYGKPASVFVVPLITRSKIIGIIATDSAADDGVPVETRETLEIFAPQIAIAIENARLYSSLQQQVAETKRSYALLTRMEKFSFLGNLAARLAHEIKNPMTAIGTFLQMLPKKFDDEEFRTEFYPVAMEETNRINRMVTELLDLVKPKVSHFDWGNLPDLIERMIMLISPRSKSKQVHIKTGFDPRANDVWMDYEKMKQVILNILSNAVDFTPVGGNIEIRTRYHLEKGDRGVVKIEIMDNGCGIPSHMLNKVFDPYVTTRHKSDIHNGTGLGLFIAHQLMQDHGGGIEIQSGEGKGTRVTLALPSGPPGIGRPTGDGAI